MNATRGAGRPGQNGFKPASAFSLLKLDKKERQNKK